MDDSCPTEVTLGTEDKAMARRVNDAVLEKIGVVRPKPRRKARKTLRTALLAAAIAALMGTAAYAANGFFMELKKTDEPVSGRWYEVDESGKVIQDQKLSYPDAGMVLTLEGPDVPTAMPEFRCWYLPSEADFGFTDEEGWSKYLSDNGTGRSIPYCISSGAVRPGSFRLVINGEVTQLGEEDWGDWHVITLTSDYTGCSVRWAYDRANFVLLLNREKGWYVNVCGTDDIEELTHIARELEIRDSGALPEHFDGDLAYSEGIGMLDPGRG